MPNMSMDIETALTTPLMTHKHKRREHYEV